MDHLIALQIDALAHNTRMDLRTLSTSLLDWSVLGAQEATIPEPWRVRVIAFSNYGILPVYGYPHTDGVLAASWWFGDALITKPRVA